MTEGEQINTGGLMPCASSPLFHCIQYIQIQCAFVDCLWQAEGTNERVNQKQYSQRERDNPAGTGGSLCFLL